MNSETQKVTQSETNDLTVDAKLNIISTCLAYATYEYNVYWQRNAIYLTINSTMAGIIAAFYAKIVPLVFILFAIFGLYLNWQWQHLNKYNMKLAVLWKNDARRVARSNDAIKAFYRVLVGGPDVQRPDGERPTQVMNRLSSSFKIIWILILVDGILKFIGIDLSGELLGKLCLRDCK